MSSTGKTFWKWILNLPNYLERDDHQTSTNSQLIRDVSADPAHGGHTWAAPRHPPTAPGIWSSSISTAPVASAAKPTV